MTVLRLITAARPSRPPDQPAGNGRSRLLKLGLGLYVAVGVLLLLLGAKPQIQGMLADGDTVTAEFASQYKLRAYDSSVKVAGVTVGTVTGIDETDKGTVKVTMKVDDEVLDNLGSAPTANIEPRTLLGGRYAIELHRGGTGAFDGHIPLAQTQVPVELDTVLEALPADAREALQGVARSGAPTVSESSDEIAALLESAPGVLRPGAPVLEAARGTRPAHDLYDVVRYLDSTARALAQSDGQLDSIVVDLTTVSTTLARHRNELAVVLAELPDTLKVARPVLRDLVPTLRELRPAVQELVPVADQANGVLKDLRGPVMDRLKGPVMDFLLNPWVGKGAYAQSAQGYQADHKVYEELAYMATNIDRASMGQDSRGSTLAFQVGVAPNSVALDGLPFSVENVVRLALDTAGIFDRKTRAAVLENAGVTE